MRVCRNRPKPPSGQEQAQAAGNDFAVSLVASSVVTIGNFDGVHRGHRALIDRCEALRAEGDALVVVTFEPLPRAFFDPANAPPRITPPSDRLRLLEQAGADLVWQMRFDAQFAALEAEDFVRSVLVDALGARHVVTGDDFRFGRGRAGNLELMRQLGADHGFVSHVVETVTLDGQRVSSGAVRTALAAGDFDTAEAMLGRPFTMSGPVQRGQELGRKLGFPTANVRVRALPCPISGVFAVEARVGGDLWRPGVASLGWRPTVGGEDMLLEVHFFDFQANLYGQRMETRFVAKLRDEAQFDTIEAMVQQMKRDEAQAREILGAR